MVEATEFRGTAVWRLRFSNDEEMTLDRFFDRESGLLVAVTIKAGSTNVTTLYEFEEHAGVLWPGKLTTISEINEYTASPTTEIQFTDFVSDAELEDHEFEMSSDESDH